MVSGQYVLIVQQNWRSHKTEVLTSGIRKLVQVSMFFIRLTNVSNIYTSKSLVT